MEEQSTQPVPRNNDNVENNTASSSFVDVDMIPCKLAFFFNSFSLGSVFPFLNLFYVESGLTAEKAGLVSGIENIISMFAVPFWGGIIDASKYRKLLLLVTCFATALTKFAKPWIVYFVAKPVNRTVCTHGEINTTFFTFNDNSSGVACVTQREVTNPNEVFAGLVVGGVLASIFYSGVMSFTEGTTVKVIYSRASKPSYGKQKFFAPIGFAIGSLISGVAVDHFYSNKLSHFTAAFYVYLPAKILLVPILYILVSQADWTFKRQMGPGHELVSILKKFDTIVFLLSALVCGLCLRTYTEFIFLFMDRELHTNKTLMSLTMLVAMVSELFVYPFTTTLIKRLGGSIVCLTIGIFSFCPRYILISYCANKWLMLPIQLFHGFGMSLAWAAQVEHAYNIFPKEVTTGALGLIASINFIISSVVTNIAGGSLYYRYGGRSLFRGAAILSGVWSVVMCVYFGVKYMSKKKDVTLETGTVMTNRNVTAANE